MQLKEKDKSRALTFRECGWIQARVAEDLGVNVRTIQRLEERSKKLKKGEIPQRKVGSGLDRLVRAKENLWTKANQSHRQSH